MTVVRFEDLIGWCESKIAMCPYITDQVYAKAVLDVYTGLKEHLEGYLKRQQLETSQEEADMKRDKRKGDCP